LSIPGTGLEVSRLCLGGNRLGAELDQAASFDLLDAFVARGGNFVDTAHVYADWLPDVERSCSEKTIGRWLAARRSDGPRIVVATKAGHPSLEAPGTSRLDEASLRADVLASLANLGVPSLDLLYLHRDDPRRPVEEIVGALEGLRAEGLVRHYAASNWTAPRLEAAQAAAARRGWQGFVANQPEWSLAARNPGAAVGGLAAMDEATLALHRRTGLPAVPYSAQAKGYFSKLAAGTLDEAVALAYDSPRNRRVAALLDGAARASGATVTQVMLAVLMRSPFPVVPVIGCRTSAQVASSFESLTLDLDPDTVRRLSNAAAGAEDDGRRTLAPGSG
jgi:aryl-alcohol dehydrogenase-like predicted oxidoreductase